MGIKWHCYAMLFGWAVVVAQLVERSLLIPEVRGLNTVIKNILNIYLQLLWKDENKKEAENGPFLKKQCHLAERTLLTPDGQIWFQISYRNFKHDLPLMLTVEKTKMKKEEISLALFWNNHSIKMGSCCDTFGRAVSSNIRWPGFGSNYQ